MTDGGHGPRAAIADLERQHDIPAHTYCGLRPADAHRVVAGNYSYSHAT